MSKLITLSKLKTALTPLIALINKKAERPNWNENNYDSVSYIENRPFYSEEKEVTFCDGTFELYNDYYNEYYTEIPTKIKLVKGQTYTVVYNGVTYTIKCTYNSNWDEYDLEWFDQDNYYYCIYQYQEGSSVWTGLWMYNESETILTSCDLTVTTIQENIVKISEKYLPKLNYSNIGAPGDEWGAEIFNDYDGNIANGNCSHAEGTSTQASGGSSHAEGYVTKALGEHSHAEGDDVFAWGSNSHAEGYKTIAYNDNSHAEGSFTLAYGYGSHAEGQGSHTFLTITGSGSTLTYENDYDPVVGDCLVFYNSNLDSLQTRVIETVMVDTKQITLDQSFEGIFFNSETIKSYTHNATREGSHVEGRDSKAIGLYSHAEGWETKALGQSSHAEGWQSEASGTSSHAEGWRTSAIGDYSHAEGYLAKAIGDYSHAEGRDTEATGEFSHVEGWETKAIGRLAHAEGYTSEANGNNSHAEGSSIANGHDSHAEGMGSQADGPYSHAEGAGAKAGGVSSHSEGNDSIAGGHSSHAEGYNSNSIVDTIKISVGYTQYWAEIEDAGNLDLTNLTKYVGYGLQIQNHYHLILEASSNTGFFLSPPLAERYQNEEAQIVIGAMGDGSHVEGENCTAHDFAHAEGRYTIAASENQHVQGKYNSPDAKNLYSHIIGNGTSDSVRSNAHTLDWSGNAWYSGDVYVGSTSGKNKDSGSKKLATEEYVNNAAATAITPERIDEICGINT